MRDTILISLLLASATATLTSASRLECLSTRSRQLAAAASCGDEGYLNYCFSNLAADTETDSTTTAALTPSLERCFVKAGCTPAESQIEAVWLLRRCDAPSPADLRRAAAQPNNNNNPNPLAAAIAARDPLPAITALAAPLLPRQTTATDGNTATAAATTSNSSPSPCFTDTTSSITSCPVQTTGSESGKKLDCFPTVVTSAVCRDGLICTSDAQGNPSCMYKQSGLGLAGAIIAAVFAAAIAVSIVSICVLCCRERRAHKRVERAAEAARIAKEAKTQATVAAKRPGVGVTGNGPSSPVVEGQPLMYQTGGGASSPGPHQTTFGGGVGGGGGGAGGQGYGAANPFADGEHDAHPLR